MMAAEPSGHKAKISAPMVKGLQANIFQDKLRYEFLLSTPLAESDFHALEEHPLSAHSGWIHAFDLVLEPRSIAISVRSAVKACLGRWIYG
jgi:hypothetical protein